MSCLKNLHKGFYSNASVKLKHT